MSGVMDAILDSTELCILSMQEKCYHCGTECDSSISIADKCFCCDGCKMVYQLLDENGMCQYYDLTNMPGLTAKGIFTSDKYNYLDNQAIRDQLIQFKQGDQAHVVFYLPQIHCVSCVWLLEHLHKINPGIIQSQTNFEKKEIKIVYQPSLITLKQVVQLLAFVGYEPMINLGGNDWQKKKKVNRKQLYKIGIAGFCFSNIMMLSFPEYLSDQVADLGSLRPFFIYLNLILSLPVLFYSASEFFFSAYTGLRQKWLNIDAPIALAILVTFGRSLYEILTQTGAGYLDSMSGIVFFMLIGRWFQDKSYDSFAFDRDYTSFFPLGVTLLKEGKEVNLSLNEIVKGDVLLVRTGEMIPADAILKEGVALVDYSFVSGENAPIAFDIGALLYAGGVQKGRAIQVEVMKPVGHSYITELWNSPLLQQTKNTKQSFVHPWSQYFTYVLFSIALFSGLYWWYVDTSKILPAVSSVLIVACPCSLLLTVTFTYGNVLRWLGKSKLYCKNATVIETFDQIDTIVFDKTGTLTNHDATTMVYIGVALSSQEQSMIRSVTRESLHPLSQMIYQMLSEAAIPLVQVDQIQNNIAKGIIASSQGHTLLIGSVKLLLEEGVPVNSDYDQSLVCIAIDGVFRGFYKVNHAYRQGISEMIQSLHAKGYAIHLLSGDHPNEGQKLKLQLGANIPMLFEQSPADKLNYIQQLQNHGRTVMMVGDGLNDAGALQKSNIGVAVTDKSHLFTPASDAILEGHQVASLFHLIHYAKKAKTIITLIFGLSIVYNLVGMYFATQALLSPMVAAILMPISSISIVALAALLSYYYSKSIRD
jgi:P-type Cu+ transporter